MVKSRLSRFLWWLNFTFRYYTKKNKKRLGLGKRGNSFVVSPKRSLFSGFGAGNYKVFLNDSLADSCLAKSRIIFDRDEGCVALIFTVYLLVAVVYLLFSRLLIKFFFSIVLSGTRLLHEVSLFIQLLMLPPGCLWSGKKTLERSI